MPFKMALIYLILSGNLIVFSRMQTASLIYILEEVSSDYKFTLTGLEWAIILSGIPKLGLGQWLSKDKWKRNPQTSGRDVETLKETE